MRYLNWLVVLLAVTCLPALAQEYRATTIDRAALRQAPGRQYGEIGSIPAGTPVEVQVCFDEGAYCAVQWQGEPGFVAGELMAVAGSGETVLSAEQQRWKRLADR